MGRKIGHRHSEETKEKIRISKIGDKNPQWKGDKCASYTSIHKWISHHYTKGSCEFCGSDRFVEWALKKGKGLEHKRENFLMLCSSCHKKYDYTEERKKKLSASLKGRKIMWKDKISASQKGKKLSAEHKAKLSKWQKEHPRLRGANGQFIQ